MESESNITHPIIQSHHQSPNKNLQTAAAPFGSPMLLAVSDRGCLYRSRHLEANPTASVRLGGKTFSSGCCWIGLDRRPAQRCKSEWLFLGQTASWNQSLTKSVIVILEGPRHAERLSTMIMMKNFLISSESKCIKLVWMQGALHHPATCTYDTL